MGQRILVFLLLISQVAYGLSNEDELLDMSFDELLMAEVEMPGKFKQTVSDSPAVVSVITAQQIEGYGANSLLEVLERMPSVQMLGSFFYPQNLAVVRGLQLTHSNNEVLLLLNGRPVRDSFTGGQSFAFFTSIPVSDIEQVEFIRGPGSVLYGSNAFTGAINIVTKKGKSNHATIKLGEFNTLDMELVLGDESDTGYWNLAAKVFNEDGWRHSAFDNGGTFGEFDKGESNYSLLFSGASGDFNWSSAVVRSKQDFWGAVSSWNSGPEQSERQVESERVTVDLGYKWRFSDERYIDSNLSYTSSAFSHYNYNANSQNLFFESSYHDQNFYDGHLLMGATIWHQDVDTESGLRAAPIPAFSRNWVNAYLQYQTQYQSSINGFIGLQYNKVPKVDANWVLRAGVNWELSQHSGIKLLWGEAFRAAYSVETHFDLVVCCDAQGNNRGGLRGNLELAPEEIVTSELQYYYQDDKNNFTATLFYNDLENLIERERAPDRVLDFVNSGMLKSRGIELEYRRNIHSNWHIEASFTHQTNESHGIDDFTLMPTWLFKVGSIYQHDSGIDLGIFVNSQDNFYSNQLRNPNSRDVNPAADSFADVSLNLRYQFDWQSSEDGEVSLYVTNLLDENIFQPEFAGRNINTHPAKPGRAIYLGLSIKF